MARIAGVNIPTGKRVPIALTYITGIGPSIANQIIAAKPTPQLKIALIAYRDRGDEYVTKISDLSGDIDALYASLMKFDAAGGGDGPESVNQALAEAVDKISWSPDKNVLKLVLM